jgi:flagellar hook-associated protein 1 FlgK
MSSIASILGIARSALSAHQTAISVTSHNVANAETQGYTRQRASLVAGYPASMPYGQLGGGVNVERLERIRDGLLDTVYRRASGNLAAESQRRDILLQLEGVFGEPSDAGLGAALDAFWIAWDELAVSPNSDSARGTVRQRGEQVARMLNDHAARVNEVASGARSRLESSLLDVNRLTSELGQLNRQIVNGEVSGRVASDLRDQRDRVLDSLAELADIQVVERGNGSVGVFLSGSMLVDGASVQQLSVLSGQPVRFAVAGSSEPLHNVGGSLGAVARVLNEDIPSVTRQLDLVASSLVQAVNELHMTGWSPAGDPAGADPAWAGSQVVFFDPDRLTAESIILAGRGPDDPPHVPPGVRNDARYVAAGTLRYGTGDNSLALAMAALRDRTDVVVPDPSNPASTRSLRDAFRDLVTGVALETQAARNGAVSNATIVNEAELRRQSVAGVSTDEELTQLMRQQQAYVAATRLVSTVDEMAQAILNMV